MKKRPNPATAHTQSRKRGAQTTSRSSALVRGRSTQFIADPCRWPQRPCPKRVYISAIFPPFSAPVEGPSTQKVEGASAAPARCKTALGDKSAAPSPDGAVAAHLLALRQRLLGDSQRLEVCRALLAGVVIVQDSSQDEDGQSLAGDGTF